MVANLLRQLTVQVPASAGNLGAGFDTVALALGLYARITFTMLEKPDPHVPIVSYSGPGAKMSPPRAQGNLIYRIVSELWRGDAHLIDHLRVSIDSDIPLNAGVGGTAAAIAGALWAAHMLQDCIPTQSDLLRQATQLEGHSETLAASLLGGFVICAKSLSGNAMVARTHRWPSKWKTILVVPPTRQDTEWSRSLLPRKVPFEDAVFNVQRVAMLVSAVIEENENALREALFDRLHEPYRAEHLPHLDQLKHLLGHEALGCVLSGAGPSVLVIVSEKQHKNVLLELKSWSDAHAGFDILDVPPDHEGIRELSPSIT